MIKVDLNESNEDRLKQLMAAMLAAAYDPIRSTASAHADPDKLGPMAYERLERIAKVAAKAAVWEIDEATAIAWLEAVSAQTILPADWN